MSIIFVVLPLAVALASCAVAAFIWAAREGQFDDLDTPPVRAVLGDDADADAPHQSPHAPHAAVRLGTTRCDDPCGEPL